MSNIACVFPGQGSQTVGMLKELAEMHPIISTTFSEASEALGYDLWDVVQNDQDGKLNQTQVTQPAILASSVAIWRAMQEEKSIEPAYLAGHSLGEYSALVCAGVLDFKQAIKLVEARGNFMQDAVPAGTGAMFAIIGLDDGAIKQACDTVSADLDAVVSPVNYNSPGQVVIAGEKAAVEKAGELCKEAGAKRALPLPVSVPSHCALMKPAAEELAALMDSMQFNTPVIPVVNNVDVAIGSDPQAIKEALVRQLYCPVRWTETVQYLAENGIDTLLEIGPGKVLAGLAKRIDKGLSATAVNTPDSLVKL